VRNVAGIIICGKGPGRRKTCRIADPDLMKLGDFDLRYILWIRLS
jgi:hypothetical protein